MSDDHNDTPNENIIKLVPNSEPMTTGDIDPDKVLEAAVGELSEVILVGMDKNHMFYLSSSTGSSAELVLLLEVAKKKVLEMVSPEV